MEKECAFDKGRDCAVLKEKKCAVNGKECSFCKTKSELISGRLRAERRIQSLPEEQLKHIKSVYYGNVMKGKEVTDDELDEFC